MVNDLDNIIDIGWSRIFLENLMVNKKKKTAFEIDLSVEQNKSLKEI